MCVCVSHIQQKNISWLAPHIYNYCLCVTISSWTSDALDEQRGVFKQKRGMRISDNDMRLHTTGLYDGTALHALHFIATRPHIPPTAHTLTNSMWYRLDGFMRSYAYAQVGVNSWKGWISLLYAWWLFAGEAAEDESKQRTLQNEWLNIQ